MAGSQPLPAGRRNTLVTVQRYKRDAQKDGSGNVNEAEETNWETATDIGNNGQLHVALLPRGSREFPRGDQIAAEITHMVEGLYGAMVKVKPKMRLVFTDRMGKHVLNIAEPPRDVDMMHHSLQFACIEVIEG